MRIVIFLLALFSISAGPFTNIQQAGMLSNNILDNPGFESGKSRWTASGGSFTLDTSSNIGFGSTSAAWDASAGSQTLCSSYYTIPKGWYGVIGKARLMYKGGDTNLSWYVDQGGTPLITHLMKANTNFEIDEANFSIPTSGTMRFCASASANAAVVYLDQIFVGLADRTVSFGSPEINIIRNPNDAGNWSSGANMTVATTVTTSELPLGSSATAATQIIPTAIKITRASGTNSAYTRFTMPASLKGRKLKLQWEQKPVSGYAAGDLSVQVRYNSASNYSGSYTTLALSTDVSSVTSIPANTGSFSTTFDADPTQDWYELDITGVAGTTALVITNVFVGPGLQPQGAVASDWISYTPTFTGFGTASAISVFYRRIGSDMWIDTTFTAGTLTATNSLMSLPTGLTLNTSFVGSQAIVVGVLASGGNTQTINALIKSADTGNVGFAIQTNAFQTLNSGTFSATAFTGMIGPIPISQWSGSGTVNVVQNDVEYVSNTSTADSADTTSFAYGPAGSAVPGALTAARKKRVSFNTPAQTTDTLLVELQPGGTGDWIPVTFYNSADNVSPYLVQNSVTYGIGIVPVSATTVDVQFGQYSANSSTTFGGVGTAWSSVTANTRYRIRKLNSGQAIGFGVVTDTSSGLMPSSNTNLDNASATRLGLMQYLHGGSYSGAAAPTVTLSSGGGTLSSVTRAVFIPYQMNDGTWRLRFVMNVVLSSASRTATVLAINGVTFKNVSGYFQNIYGNTYNVGLTQAYVAPNAGTIELDHSSTTTTTYGASGDVELNSKPTWAY